MTSFSFNADSDKKFFKQILAFNTQWNGKRFLLKPLLPILYASNHMQKKNLVNKNKGRPGEHQE